MSQIIGRIYKIVSSECDGCYVGSTTKQLSTRFSDHKSSYKRYLSGKGGYYTSFEVLKFVDASVELIHEGVFDSRKDMEHLEGELIRTTPNAMNKNVAGRTKKEHYHDNREAIRAYQKTQCTCPICGSKYTLPAKSRHLKTKKHLAAVSSASSGIDTSETSEASTDCS